MQLKLSREEKFLRKMELAEKRNARTEANRQKKQEKKLSSAAAKIPKEKKPEPSEEELVKRYVNRVIKNQGYHGRIKEENFSGLGATTTANKNLWLDTDFYFSVVFQSRAQKMQFLEKWEQFTDSFYEEDVKNVSRINIVNGLELAKSMGIELTMETRKDYPSSNLDLMPLILDNESL